MKYKLKVYSIYEYGKRVDAQGNPHQEDSMFPLHGKACDDDRLFILCDGMGGHDAGEVASATVCEEMSRSVLSRTEPEGSFAESDFQKALTAAFDALDEKDTGAMKKMGTTMTFLKLHEGGCFIAHIGDSRVYHIRPGKTGEDTKIIFVTEDHSLVNDLVKIGEITSEQAKTDRRKNIITRAMQPKMERRPRAGIHASPDVKAGDYFYLCSDGMLEMMDDFDLRNMFSESGVDDAVKVKRLTKATDGNRDNHSAIIVHVLEVEGEDAGKRTDSSAPTGSKPCDEGDKDDAVQVLTVEDDEAPEAGNNPDDGNDAGSVEENDCPTPPEGHRSIVKEVKLLRIAIVALIVVVILAIMGFCLIRKPPKPEKRGGPEDVEQMHAQMNLKIY